MSEFRLGRLLGAGREAEAFECGDKVVKLYKTSSSKLSAFREAANLTAAHLLGLPVPETHGLHTFDGRWGIVMAKVEGPSFDQRLGSEPTARATVLARMVALQLQLHRQRASHLVALKLRLKENIGRANLDETLRNRLLDLLAQSADGDRVCHGDFHPFNILGSLGQPTIVDWLDASCGDPAADVCRSYLLMSRPMPQVAADYVSAYAAASGMSPQAVFDWLPIVAAARLAEAVPNETPRLLAMLNGV
jgi:aminoglycoside phosphotransferase (APT) family kinase protein